MEGDRERCLAAGMDDYLAKPFGDAAMREALARWTGPDVAFGAAGPDNWPAGATVPTRLFDPVTARRLHEDFPPEVLRRLATLFVEHTPGAIEAIAAAVAEDDADALWRAAHRLKGSCRAVGAAMMQQYCSELEASGRRGDTSAGADLVEELRDVFEPTVEVVRLELAATTSAAR